MEDQKKIHNHLVRLFDNENIAREICLLYFLPCSNKWRIKNGTKIEDHWNIGKL